jgi:hypothetical protein
MNAAIYARKSTDQNGVGGAEVGRSAGRARAAVCGSEGLDRGRRGDLRR